MSAYVEAQLEDSPLSAWPLQEDGGAVAGDAVADRSGTHENGPEAAIDGPAIQLARGVRYDGEAAQTRVSSDPQISGFSDFTVEFWIRILTWPDSQRGVFGIWDTGDGQRSWAAYIRAGSGTPNDVMAIFLSGDGSFQTSGNHRAPIPREYVDDGQWHHVAFRRAGSTLDGIVDAVPRADSLLTFSGTLHTSTADMLFGATQAGLPHVHAELAGLAVYGHALIDERITAHFEAARLLPITKTITLPPQAREIELPAAVREITLPADRREVELPPHPNRPKE